MSLKCGIVGLPNVGKSTLFNAISNAGAEAANFLFCTIEPNVGVVTVPDPRLQALEKIVEPEKVVPTIIEFVDIAGLVQGASKGEGLGNQFLANIREVDAIVHVTRCFDDDNIIHVDGEVGPVKDKDIIDTELQLKDLETLEKRKTRIEKIAKSGDASAKKELEVINQYISYIEGGNNARGIELSEEDKELVKILCLLTEKPVIYVANVGEDDLANNGNAHVEALKEAIKTENAQIVLVSASIESQIAELNDEEEKAEFLEEYGLKESGLDKLIQASYALLNLITYFTAGKTEVRAWTIEKGWKAPKAASVIHTDFEKGFIKAEVMKYQNFIELGSELACKEAGKLAIEGKEYVVEDGDIMHFRFNV